MAPSLQTDLETVRHWSFRPRQSPRGPHEDNSDLASFGKRMRPLSASSQVRFSPMVQIQEVLHKDDYTHEEIKATWYSNKEIRSMKRHTKRLGLEPNQEDAHRGLESRSSHGSLRKRQRKAAAWEAVFVEQRLQNRIGVHDPEALADAYFEAAEPARVTAHMLAVRDAREILWIQLVGNTNIQITDSGCTPQSTPSQDEFRPMAQSLQRVLLSTAA